MTKRESLPLDRLETEALPGRRERDLLWQVENADDVHQPVVAATAQYVEITGTPLALNYLEAK